MQSLDVTGPAEVFAAAGNDVTVVTSDGAPIRSSSGLQFVPHADLSHAPTPIDTMVVAGGDGTPAAVGDAALIEWLRATAPRCRRVTSVCSGAFLLAEAGLLDGRRATTHWASIERKRVTYPTITVLDGRRFVDEGNVLTSAGISAGIDLSLHVVERLLGREVAEQTARTMEYDWYRDPTGASRPGVPA